MGANTSRAVAGLDYLIGRWAKGTSTAAQANVAKLTAHRDKWVARQAPPAPAPKKKGRRK